MIYENNIDILFCQVMLLQLLTYIAYLVY